MRITRILLLALTALSSGGSAHMEMISPAALLTKGNPNTGEPTSESYDMKGPLSPDGSNFPCKGTLKSLGTSQGASVATWQAGSRQTWILEGATTHGGGSCQASISTDQGRSFKVVHSYIGGCPLKLSWDFKVPNDTPQGPALFAFSWNNRGGNREFYMNCASITISGGGGRESTSFNSRPNILRAHSDNGACRIAETFDVDYPDPGPDVTRDPNAKSLLPTGDCGSSVSGPGGEEGRVSPPLQGGFSGSGGTDGTDGGQDPFNGNGGGNLDSQPAQRGGAPVSGSDCAGFPPPIMALPLMPSVTGDCGQQYSCINSLYGSCCNAQGRCGKSAEDCGLGCQGAYGRCCDAQGNPNAGFRGRSVGVREPRVGDLLKSMAVAVVMDRIWDML